MSPCPYSDACERNGLTMCWAMVMRNELPDGPDGRTIESELVDQWWSTEGNPETDPRRCWQNRN